MMRIAHGIIVAAAFIGMSVLLLGGVSDPESPTYESWGEVLDAKLECSNKFRAETDQTFAAIVEEKLPLDKAVEQIMAASAQHFPDYLTNMRFMNGNDLKVAVGESIILHFVVEIKLGENKLIPVVDRLRAEQAKLKSASQQ